MIPAHNVLDLIGNTPMVDVSNLSPNPNVRISPSSRGRTRSAR
jgi:hypothetical protein